MARRRGLGTGVALAGLVILVLAAPVLRDKVLREAATETAGPATPAEQSEAREAERVAVAPMPAIARPVAPQVITPPSHDFHELERIEAREPLSPMGRAHVPSEGPPKETVLHRPLVTQAGAFEAMGYRVLLPGLVVTPETEMCGDGEGAWPCGIHARTAFRNWLRGRALACVVPPAPPAETVTTPCRLGAFDAGAWLVEQGWVRADPADDRYAELAEDARRAGRGLHGAGTAAHAPLPAITLETTDETQPAAELAD